MITNVAELGAWIRAARKQAGMTQASLAEKAGIARNSLIALESGRALRAEIGKVFRVLSALDTALEPVAYQRPSFKQALEQSVGRPI
jgi:transcriptional regulator with XRE-family HTH domain